MFEMPNAKLSGRIGPAIKEVIITPIAITDPPLLNAAGLHAPYALRTIVELVTDDGISGISEIPGNKSINESLETAGKLILGKDPFQLNYIKQALENHFGKESITQRGDAPWDQRKLVHIFSAIEVACLDLMGKITGRPIVDLLGGKMRERVPFAAYLFYKHEGAGGEWGFNTDPKARGMVSCPTGQGLRPHWNCGPGTGHVQGIWISIHKT